MRASNGTIRIKIKKETGTRRRSAGRMTKMLKGLNYARKGTVRNGRKKKKRAKNTMFIVGQQCVKIGFAMVEAFQIVARLHPSQTSVLPSPSLVELLPRSPKKGRISS